MKTSNNNKIILPVLISLLVFTFFSCKKEENKNPVLSAQTVFGDVTVESDGIITTPVSGTEIKENSIIKTGKLSIIDLKYKDSGVIRINENSILNISRLFISEQADETVLKMDKGKVFVSVSKLLKKSKFEVKTATTVAAVRGTTFRVSAESGKSRIDVLHGKIKVNPVKDNKVIENVEQYVETNNAIEIEDTAIDEIIEEKKEIEVVRLEQEDIENIKEEVRLIKMDESIADETKIEMEKIGIETKTAEEVKNEDLYREQLTIQLQKLEQERLAKEEKEKQEAIEAEEKEKEVKLQKETEEKRQLQERQKKEELRKEELRKEQLRIEQLNREKAEKERQAKEQKIKEEKKKEENRVKNIPNF